MDNIIVWHRRDLRTVDNHALAKASGDGIAYPVFVIDPFFFRENNETNPDRILFMFEYLEDLDRQYKKLGSSLSILFGDSIKKICEYKDKLSAKVYYNFDTNMNFGLERDHKVKASQGFKGFTNDAIVREGDSRTSWHSHCADYFNSKEYFSKALPKNIIESEVTLNEIKEKFSIKKEKSDVPKGGSEVAYKRLKDFLKNIDLYTKSISKPLLAEDHTSRLSAHMSLGAISVKSVYKAANEIQAKQKRFFITRLFWNQHFTQKMQDNPTLTSKSVNPVFEENYDKIYDHNEEYIAAWKKGKTGYPLVDASMRALVKTGFLNFRMRAMVASFFTYILRQNWKIGADFMHYHLIDADVAINYSQWQMQAGMVGVHPNRIYNPKKQILDNDKNCAFIKKYVEELKDVPAEYIIDPSKIHKIQYTLNHAKNDELDKIKELMSKYTEPIVSFERMAKKAKKDYKELNALARQRLYSNPDLLKKASLSGRARQRHDKKEKTDTKIV